MAHGHANSLCTRTLMDDYIDTLLVATIVGTALSTATTVGGFLVPFEEYKNWRRLAFNVWQRLIFIVLGGVFVSSALFIICAIFLDFIAAFEKHGKSWPTSIRCPQLWKDPEFIPAI